MPFPGVWRHVVLVRTNVSEEFIDSIFRVEKSAIEEPTRAGSCGLSCQSETTSYIRTGREREWAKWEINSEERGGQGSVEMVEQVAGRSRYWSVSGGARKGYWLGIGPIASELFGQPCIDLRSLKMEAICSSETPIRAKTTRPHNPENGILHSHCFENLKSYILFEGYLGLNLKTAA
jgi:hypothetical protein